MIDHIHKNGKLLLCGEYAVLDGALALAIPTKYGQKFTLDQSEHSDSLNWQALDNQGQSWFDAVFHIESLELVSSNNPSIARELQNMLKSAQQLNPRFLSASRGIHVTSQLEFPRSWGLGSSSTLIAAVAQWSQTDPYILSNMSFGGSGYDVAAANLSQAFTYQILEQSPQIRPMNIQWTFIKDLYFIHRNKKQNSRQSIAHYRAQKNKRNLIDKISGLTQAMIHTNTPEKFGQLMTEHEEIIGKAIKCTPVKQELFNDFPGAIKSLGGWGGDFIMALSTSLDQEKTQQYFKSKGYDTVIAFREMTAQDSATNS